jgi:hypothetical protein
MRTRRPPLNIYKVRLAITLLDPSNIGEKEKKRTISSLEDTSSLTPLAPQGTNTQHVSKKARVTSKLLSIL